MRRSMKVLAAGFDATRPPKPGVVVLIYHRVDGPGGSVDLSPACFDEQMAALAGSGLVCTLDEGLDQLGDLSRPASSSVVVTFDDGTADFVDHAVPVLVRHGVPALLYLATGFVEAGTGFPGGGPAVSWSGLADACGTGLVDIGSHTHSHLLLDRAPAAEAANELDRSIGLIGDRLDRQARHFAYPKALLGSPETEAAVRARFVSAAVAGTRPNVAGRTDRYRLARSPVQVADGMRWFHHKVRGGMRLEDELRQRVNRARHARATT